MPLSINEPEEIPDDGQPEPQPILHHPKPDYTVLKSIAFSFFIIIIIVSVIFLVHSLSSRSNIESISTQTVKEQSKDVKAILPPVINDSINNQIEKPKSDIPSSVIITGNYTIYVGSFTKRTIAEKEVARWNESGFPAEIVKAGIHFRVAIGRYETIEDAKSFAQNLNKLLENGYWIGSLR